MKYCFMEENRSTFEVKEMCQSLKISRSGYYRWRKGGKSLRAQENEQLVTAIREAHSKSRQCYGSPRITEELRAGGYQCSKNRIARLMKKHGIVAKMRRRFKVTTHSKHSLPVAKNVLQKNFSAEAPNRVWTSDITYVRTDEGWLYVATVLDIYSRQIVGWSMHDRLTQELTINALQQALGRRSACEGLIFHSDRGVQYASWAFRTLLKRQGFVQSMSGKGNCYDNAIMETFFHTLKTELVYFEKYRTKEEARRSIFEYIELFYNRVRRHSALNYKSPMEFEMLARVA
jgi:putative transposase